MNLSRALRLKSDRHYGLANGITNQLEKNNFSRFVLGAFLRASIEFRPLC